MVKMQGVLWGQPLEFRKLGIQEKHSMGDLFKFFSEAPDLECFYGNPYLLYFVRGQIHVKTLVTLFFS